MKNKVAIAQVVIGGRIVYENPIEMYKIRYNRMIDRVENLLDATELKDAKELINQIKNKK